MKTLLSILLVAVLGFYSGRYFAKVHSNGDMAAVFKTGFYCGQLKIGERDEGEAWMRDTSGYLERGDSRGFFDVIAQACYDSLLEPSEDKL